MCAEMLAVELISINLGQLQLRRLFKVVAATSVYVGWQNAVGPGLRIERFGTGRRQTTIEFTAPADIAVARLRFTPARRKIPALFASKV
jgi:hypothetical protein